MRELIKDQKNRNLGMHLHKCRLCGAEGEFQSYLVREMMYNTGDEFEYFVCPQCSTLQIGEIPDDLGKYYGSSYYSFGFSGNEDTIFCSPITDTRKLLDVGCGSGEWLYEMAEEGMCNLYGCDPFLEKDITIGDRIHIKKCSIHEMDGDGTFDVVRMGDSFEHVTDPIPVLEDALRLIKDDGIIAFSVPTFPNIAFQMYETHWYQLDAPRHIFLPSMKAIKMLADKYDLYIREYEYNSNASQFISSFFYQHGIPFVDINDELAMEFFSQEEFAKLNKYSDDANKNHYGDHMNVVLAKKK